MTDFTEGDTANYQFARVTLQAFRGDKLIRTMTPEKRFYKSGDGQSTTEVELYSTPKEDLYVIFAGISNDGKRSEITAHVNPLVWWVWFGSGIMFLGTLVTLLPDRKGAFTIPSAVPDTRAAIGETVKLT
jgi:cytochrome c-type biogenesis protein CcmF